MFALLPDSIATPAHTDAHPAIQAHKRMLKDNCLQYPAVQKIYLNRMRTENKAHTNEFKLEIILWRQPTADDPLLPWHELRFQYHHGFMPTALKMRSDWQRALSLRKCCLRPFKKELHKCTAKADMNAAALEHCPTNPAFERLRRAQAKKEHEARQEARRALVRQQQMEMQRAESQRKVREAKEQKQASQQINTLRRVRQQVCMDWVHGRCQHLATKDGLHDGFTDMPDQFKGVCPKGAHGSGTPLAYKQYKCQSAKKLVENALSQQISAHMWGTSTRQGT